MMQSKTGLPNFDSAAEEAAFWETHDSAPYWDKMEEVKIEVRAERRPSKMISLRMSEEYLGALKTVAEQKGIPYQTLMRLWLVERLREEGAL